MNLNFRVANIGDIDILLPFARRTFDVAFSHLNDPEDFQSYMKKAFNKEGFKRQLENENSQFWLLESDENLIGYLKLNFSEAQTDINDEESLEIERIYISPKSQGQGLGKLIIEKAVEIAQEAELKYIWLGVWDINSKAIKFYQREGFKIFGTHDFPIGSEIQTDYLMRRYI